MLIYCKHLFKVFQETNPNPSTCPGALPDCQVKMLCICRQVAASLKICQIFYLIIYEGCFTIRAVSYLHSLRKHKNRLPLPVTGIQGCPGRTTLLGWQLN